jgi:chorismate synthase
MEKVIQTISASIVIRELESTEEFEAAFQIQAKLPEFCKVGLIPSYYMQLISKRGGIVLGCFCNNQLVGYNFAFPCISPSLGVYLFADSMGFLPSYQRKHLGYHVKHFQYRLARSKGIRYVVWTYDPLKGVNANINIRKLGGEIVRYIPDQYTTVNNNVSLYESTCINFPEDRFEVIWDLQSEKVKERMEKNDDQKWDHLHPILVINPIKIDYKTFCNLPINNPNICVEIPLDFQSMLMTEPSLALQWRLSSRKVFQYFLQNGYQINDFFHLDDKATKKNLYLLKKSSTN